MKSLYQHVRQVWKKPKQNLGAEAYQARLIQWRREPAVIKIERPTRIDRARSLGYKAKQGYIVVRARIGKGTTKRPRITKGRRPKRYGRCKIVPSQSKQRILEGRAVRKYANMEVLNSYWVGDDSKHKWYEIILVDRDHPVIRADKKINWISTKKGRVSRGLTSAGKKSRGLRK